MGISHFSAVYGKGIDNEYIALQFFYEDASCQGIFV